MNKTEYPDGLMFRYGSDVYYVKRGVRYRLYSPRVFKSWGLAAIPAGDDLLKTPVNKSPLGFRDGTLIHNYADGRLYVISAGKRRQITSPDVMSRFGWRKREFLVVSNDEAELHAEGEPLT